MFPAAYFGDRYFARRYWPGEPDSADHATRNAVLAVYRDPGTQADYRGSSVMAVYKNPSVQAKGLTT